MSTTLACVSEEEGGKLISLRDESVKEKR